MKIDVRTTGMKEALAMYDPKIVKRAARLAINECATTGRGAASRIVRSKFALPAGRVNQEIKVSSKASQKDLSSTIRAAGKSIGLMNFKPTWRRGRRIVTAKGTQQTKRASRSSGVSVTIIKGQKTLLPDAFIGRGRAGSVDQAGALQVFERAGSGRRSHLVRKAVVTIASMFDDKKVQEGIAKEAGEKFDSRFLHHMDRLLKR